MRYEVVCKYCNVRVCECDVDSLYELGLFLTRVHTGLHPHNGAHPLTVLPDFSTADGDHEIKFRCTQPTCKAVMGTEATYRCNKEMLSVVTILFHSHHEGHGMEIVLDGTKIVPYK